MPAPDHKTRTLCLTGMLHGFTHLYGVALLPLYLLIQHDFGFPSVEKATSLMTVMMVAYFAPSYALGVLADRCSRKKLLAAGLVLNALAFIGLAFASNYFWALIAVIVAGVGGSCYHPAATAMIARLFPQTTGRALGFAGIGAGAGFFLGPLYTGWRAAMLEPVLGAAAWRRPILEIGVFGLIAAVLFAALAKEETVAETGSRDQARAERLFPTRTLWLFFVAFAFLFGLRDFAGNGMASLGSLFLQKAEGFDTRHAGAALSALFLASMVSNPLLGSLSDGRRKRWITIVLCAGAALMAVFPHLPARWTLPCFAAFGFFFQASYPMVEAALMQSVPDAVRGRVFGFYVTITGLLGGIAHWVAGAVVKRLGDAAFRVDSYFPLYAALAGLGLIALLGLPCLHAIRKRETVEGMPEPDSAFRTPRSTFQ
jgi:FSR family fosmidomycin resistance protein-like MFS transporter